MNPYLQVASEAAHAASLIPFSSEAAYYAMRSFGGYNMSLALACASLGALTGQMANWIVGFALLQLPSLAERAPTLSPRARRYGIWLLPFSAVAPLGSFLPLIAGFLGVRLRIALPLILLGVVAHYLWLAYN